MMQKVCIFLWRGGTAAYSRVGYRIDRQSRLAQWEVYDKMFCKQMDFASEAINVYNLERHMS
jgi:hypothetical protein